MSHQPKKGEVIIFKSGNSLSPFTPGCEYTVERYDRKINHAYVYNDEGTLTPIDFPHDVVYGKFENQC